MLTPGPVEVQRPPETLTSYDPKLSFAMTRGFENF